MEEMGLVTPNPGNDLVMSNGKPLPELMFTYLINMGHRVKLIYGAKIML